MFDVFTEDNEGEIEIVDLLPSTPHTDPALCRLIQERGVCEAVSEGKGVLYTHTFSTPHMTTVVVENKVQLTIFVCAKFTQDACHTCKSCIAHYVERCCSQCECCLVVYLNVDGAIIG